MIRTSAKSQYICVLKVFSFSIRVISNSCLFLDEFRQLTSAFQSVTEENKIDVEYEVMIQTEGNGKHILARNGEIIYENPDWTDLLLILQERFLDDFIKSTDDHYLLHSAVLVKKEKAIVLPAASKSGKSTLSIALVKNGFKYLSDEVTAVNLGTLRVRGFPRAIAIREKTLSLFPSLEPEINYLCYRLLSSRKVREIHYGILSEKKLASIDKSFPISAIVFPKYNPNSDTILTEVDPAVAVFNLMRCSFNQRRLKEKGFRTAARLVRQIKSYTLQVKNLAKTCEIINSLV
jgi:hypothetical protein